jgi:hypothetical protein
MAFSMPLQGLSKTFKRHFKGLLYRPFNRPLKGTLKTSNMSLEGLLEAFFQDLPKASKRHLRGP